MALCTLLAIALPMSGCKKKKSADEALKDLPVTGEYVSGKALRVPLIAWGADLVTIYANGMSPKTLKGSLFDRQGISVDLFREDNFIKQTEMYRRGEIVFLRGTMGMINMSAELLSSEPGMRPVLIYQHS